jgi:hypothetical protein
VKDSSAAVQAVQAAVGDGARGAGPGQITARRWLCLLTGAGAGGGRAQHTAHTTLLAHTGHGWGRVIYRRARERATGHGGKGGSGCRPLVFCSSPFLDCTEMLWRARAEPIRLVSCSAVFRQSVPAPQRPSVAQQQQRAHSGLVGPGCRPAAKRPDRRIN